MKEKAKTYVKIDRADIKAQVDAAKQAGCQPPCGTCTDDGDTCTGCIYPLTAAATFGTDTNVFDYHNVREWVENCPSQLLPINTLPAPFPPSPPAMVPLIISNVC